MQTQPAFIGPVSLLNGYRDPMQLGADRWHCMLGACFAASQSTRGLVVVNAGTATTVDCIEATTRAGNLGFAGRFVGGVIGPGVRLMSESLKAGTAGLPVANGIANAFPDNTDAAIVTGVLDAQTGLVQQIWRRFADRLAAAPQLVLTGGNAAMLAPRLSIGSAVIADNLVLRGLALRAAEISLSQ
jgi:type III pantothenate kinase